MDFVSVTGWYKENSLCDVLIFTIVIGGDGTDINVDRSTADCSDTDRALFNSNLLNNFSIEFETVPELERSKFASS